MFQISLPRIRLRVVLLPGIPCSFLLRDTKNVSLKKPTKVGIPQKKRARILCEGRNKSFAYFFFPFRSLLVYLILRSCYLLFCDTKQKILASERIKEVCSYLLSVEHRKGHYYRKQLLVSLALFFSKGSWLRKLLLS